MIIKAEIINQPYSGQFKEKIYDISTPWNSQNWTWVKFEDEDYHEWCGVFRGYPRAVALSKKYNKVLVLTSDHLFQVDCYSRELFDYESQTPYQCLTVTPSGDFIIADYYDIQKIESTLKVKSPINSPIKMDKIEFLGWVSNKLLIRCDEFLNWDNHVVLELCGDTYEITLKDID
ncbi:hypothetical protein [Paucisalibacillus globulus]|uniref:hypothetical protein n=1 Tax=Paucisalibacillus globulus TaxID=351095 RepID=UPI000BB95815|nr:hypothetical protein [Paucisalibacillus globulus]